MSVSAIRMRHAALRLQWLNHVNELPALPPNISTQSMSDQAYEDMLAILPGGDKLQLKRSHLARLAPAQYKTVRFDGKVRFMDFPHPAPYSNTVNALSKNWRHISNRIKNDYSVITPRWHPQDDRIVIFTGNYRQPKFSNFGIRSLFPSSDILQLDFHFIRGRVLNLDITNFFPSIYTHALEWVLSGRGRPGSSSVGADVDKAFQMMRSGRTDGISIGPVTSNIAAEIILSTVDEYLIGETKSKRLNYVRAVDDFTILARRGEDTTELVNSILSELNKVSLTLNPAKQKETSYREYFADHISTIVTLSLVPLVEKSNGSDNRVLFSELRRLAEEKPRNSILKYGWKAIRSAFRKSSQRNQEAFLSRSWEVLATAPHLTAEVVSETLNSRPFHSLSELSPYVCSLLEMNLSSGYTDASCWLFYFAKRTAIDIGSVLDKLGFTTASATDLLSTWLDSFVALEILNLGNAEYNAKIRDIFTDPNQVLDDRTEDWSIHWPIRYELFRKKLVKEDELEFGELRAFRVLLTNHFSLLNCTDDD